MDFEDQFAQALREAGQTYEIETPPLYARGLRRGRTLRVRRVAAAVLGSATALALVATGTALSVGALDGSGTRPTAIGGTPSVSSGPSVSGAQILDLLTGLLPAGKVSQEQANGAGAGRPVLAPASAQLVYDDGHGAAQLQLAVIPVNDKNALGTSTCPSGSETEPAGVTCKQVTLADGSTVAVQTEPLGKVRLWTATLVTRSGDRVWLDETNSELPDGPVTRAAPPLSAAQLSAVVEDSGWNQVFTAVRYSLSHPDGQPSQAQVIAAAGRARPAGVTFGANVAENQEGSAAFSLGNGWGRLSLNVQYWPAQARSEITGEDFASATRLPDGTLMATEQQTQSVGVPASRAVMWRVKVLRPDGTMVEVTENSMGLPGSSKVTVSMTMAQLKAFAMNSAWTQRSS